MDIKAVRTTVGCPWLNGVVERWVGSCRRELLGHGIAVNEMHLKRLLASYVDYYHGIASTVDSRSKPRKSERAA